MRQKIELGRYARQSVLQWDRVPLIEFIRYHGVLVDVMNAEPDSAPSSLFGEDYG